MEGCDSFEDVSSHCQLWTSQNLEQLQKDLNWWPKSVKVPKICWSINCTVTLRWFIRLFLMNWEVGTSLQRMGGRSRDTACEDFTCWRSVTHLIHLTSCLLPFFCSLSGNCPEGRRFQDIKDNEKSITCTINTFLWMPSVTILYNS